jgi:hypothetical protein
MDAILKQSQAMNMNDLTRLSYDELVRVKNRNFLVFQGITLLNLLGFYHSISTENWFMLFLSFGTLIAALAVYDNYRVSKELLENY